MAEVELNIAGRSYPVRCRDGEEENLLAAGRLLDSKCREALSGLGTLTESRQFFYAALLLADQIMERQVGSGDAAPQPAPTPEPAPPPAAAAQDDPEMLLRAENLTIWLESLADSLEHDEPVT